MVRYIILAIIILIAIIILRGYVRSPKTKGRRGEAKVSNILGGDIENEKYVFNNYVILNNGISSQIDHILINAKGVFVIETKNYSGYIYGGVSQQEWTQSLKYGRVKNKFYNPIKQNATHAHNIRNILPKDIPIIPVVVFVQNNIDNINSAKVINLRYLPYFIDDQPNVLTAEQINECHEILLNKNSRDSVSDKEHINHIQATQSDIANNICPRCGKSLVLRNGKYGDFYGCSGYPKCRFTKKLN
jgi:hypothetical protein